MSWASENKFLTGFGVVMLAGVGTLGYLTWTAMGKYEDARGTFDSASAQLKQLEQKKPSLTNPNLTELLAQKQALTDKIGEFQTELKSRVLPVEPIKKEAFQDLLKDTVARVAAKATEAKVERPKDFYMGFAEYQSKPPDDKAAPLLARQLSAIELVMGVLIKTGNLDLDELHRDTLPEEGRVRPDASQPGSGRKKNSGGSSDHGVIERHGLRLKFTSSDDALRKILTDLANHKQQLFVIRNVSVHNKQAESPPRVGAVAPPPQAPAAPEQPAPEQPAPAPAPPAVPGAVPPAPAAPAPAAPAPAEPVPVPNEGPLAYVFGTEKIVTILDLEILNVEEPKSKSEKPEKGGKKKEK